MAELRLYRHQGYDGVEREYIVLTVDLDQCDEDAEGHELVETITIDDDVNSWPTDRTLLPAE